MWNLIAGSFTNSVLFRSFVIRYPGEVIPARTAERPTPRRKASVAACGRRHAEYTMILPYSHSPSVKSVAGNG